MLAMVVYINNKKVCSVELTQENTRGVQWSWIGNKRGANLIFLHVGGMDDDEHVSWEMPQLKLGDEVTVKVTEDIETDLPHCRKSAAEMDQLSKRLGQLHENRDK